MSLKLKRMHCMHTQYMRLLDLFKISTFPVLRVKRRVALSINDDILFVYIIWFGVIFVRHREPLGYQGRKTPTLS